MKPAKLMIGGEEVILPPLTLDAMIEGWDAIDEAMKAKGFKAQASTIVTVLALSLRDTRPELDEAGIRKRMVGPEYKGLVPALSQLLAVSGLIEEPKSGGAPAGSEAGRSPRKS